MSDPILKIFLEIKSDIADLQKVIGGLGDVQKGATDAAQAGFGLKQAFEFAGANELLHSLVETLKEIPAQIFEGLKAGIEFNAEVQRLDVNIAAVLRQTQGQKFLDFESAKQQAGLIVGILKDSANAFGQTYRDMFDTYAHSQNVLNSITHDISDQIKLISTLKAAVASAVPGGTTQAKDIVDILAGMSSRTIGGKQLAVGMGFADAAELDKGIQKAMEAGTALDFFMTHLAGFREGISSMSQTFGAEMNRMRNSITDFQSEFATGMMQPLQQAATDAEHFLNADEIKASARTWGQVLGQMTLDVENLSVAMLKSKGQIQGIFGSMSLQQMQTGRPAPPTPGEQLFNQNVIDIQTEALTKQRDLMYGIVTTAKDAAAQSAARASLDTLVATIQKEIADGIFKDAEAAKVLLGTLKEWQTSFKDIVGTAAAAAAAIHAIAAAEIAFNLQNELTFAKAYGTPDQQYKAEFAVRYNKILEEQKRLGQDINEGEATQLAVAQMAAVERGKDKGDHQDITALMREESTILQGIRQQQQLISQDSFLSAESKDALLANLYIKEQAVLLNQIAAIKAKIKEIESIGGPKEQTEVDQLKQKLQQLGFEYVSLGEKLKTTGFLGNFTKDLATWVNSFGTASHQIANLIEGTINQTLQATNQLLLDAVFRTGDWRQTVVGLERSVLNMFLTMLEQMALQQVMKLLHIGETTVVNAAAGEATAIAWAPAAGAVSIATEGEADIQGQIAAVEAIASIDAAVLGGGFAGGGFTGYGGSNEIAGVAHKNEFVFPRSATENIGLSNLYALMHAAPHFGEGGGVDIPPIGSDPHNFPPDRPPPIWDPNWPFRDTGQYNPGDLTGDPVVQIPRWYRDDGRLDPWTLGNPDVSLADWGGGWDPSGAPVVNPSGLPGGLPSGLPGGPGSVETGGLFPGDPRGGGTSWPPSIEINPGDLTGDVSGNAQYVGTNPRGEPIYGDAEGHLYSQSGALVPVGTHVIPANPFSGIGGIPSSVLGVLAGAQPPTQPAWFQPGYHPSTGIQDAINRGDYSTAYGQSRSSQENAALMNEMANAGGPNRMTVPDSGISLRYAPESQRSIWGRYQVSQSDAGTQSYLALLHTLSGNNYNQAQYNAAHHNIPHGATGLRLPGAPSNQDSILAWLAAGEHVIPADTVAVLDRNYGLDWPQKLAQTTISMPRPHFADGGRVDGPASSGSSVGLRSQQAPIKINVFTDWKAAIRDARNESDFRSFIVDTIKGAAHEIGIGAVNQ